MLLTTFPGAITLTISHLFFLFFVIKRIISGTLSNLLEFSFDYIPRSLFISKDLILGWISLVKMETNFIAWNKGQFSWRKFSPKEHLWGWALL